MEYVKGQTLRDILKVNGALSQRDAEQVMMGVLNALEYSHRMGIIHRDIKPGNIMISEQGVVKVMDFGIARALDDSAATMTQSQGVVGTRAIPVSRAGTRRKRRHAFRPVFRRLRAV